METEWKKVNKRNTIKKILVIKTKDNYENYYNKFEEPEFDMVNTKPYFK